MSSVYLQYIQKDFIIDFRCRIADNQLSPRKVINVEPADSSESTRGSEVVRSGERHSVTECEMCGLLCKTMQELSQHIAENPDGCKPLTVMNFFLKRGFVFHGEFLRS